MNNESIDQSIVGDEFLVKVTSTVVVVRENDWILLKAELGSYNIIISYYFRETENTNTSISTNTNDNNSNNNVPSWTRRKTVSRPLDRSTRRKVADLCPWANSKQHPVPCRGSVLVVSTPKDDTRTIDPTPLGQPNLVTGFVVVTPSNLQFERFEY